MARINPWDQKYRRPEPYQETREFDFGSERVPITLRQMGEPEFGQFIDRADETIADHLRGRAGQPPLPVAAPDAKPIPLSEYLLNNAVTLQVMQVPEAGDEPYSLLDWLGIAVKFKDTWRQILDFSTEVQAGGKKPGETPAGNSERTATGALSEPPSA